MSDLIKTLTVSKPDVVLHLAFKDFVKKCFFVQSVLPSLMMSLNAQSERVDVQSPFGGVLALPQNLHDQGRMSYLSLETH